MRFGMVHRVMTDALATLGVLALISAAQGIPAVTRIAIMIGLVAALCVPEKWQSRPALRHVSTIGPLALFVIQGLRLLTHAPPINVAVEFAALLQVIRLATRRGAAHDQQIIVLALLHFVAGTVLGGSLTYGLCFMGFLIVAPGALVLSHLRREVEGNYRQGARDRTGLPVDVPRILRSRRVVGKGFLAATCFLAFPILLFTAVLFIIFPRVGLSLLLLNSSAQDRITGFSDKVNLGEVGVLRSNSALALRVEMHDLKDPPETRIALHLRGTAFDIYDGTTWSREKETQPVARLAGSPDTYEVLRVPDPEHDRRMSIDLEPIDPAVIFLPPRATGIQLKAPNQALLGDPLVISRGAEGDFHYGGADTRGLHYDALFTDHRETLSEVLKPEHVRDPRRHYLQIPDSMPTRVSDKAHQWTDGLATPFEKAKAIESHLQHDYTYDLTSPSGGQEQPLDHFLFVSLRGHCEFFSTAMAIMLREVGIPSRNVTGFVGGTYNRFGGYYAVRQGDAHSWVEAFIDYGGHASWETFDPTPPAGATPIDSGSGPLSFLRDVFEALSQRWNKYVVGYDLRTQVKLFDEVSRRYEDLRSKVGVDKGALGSLTQGPVVAGLAIVLFVSGYIVWKRRKQRRAGRPLDARRPEGDAKLESAATLYRSLESAIASHGLSRPASLPPLRHAEEVRARNHPLSPEILALTHIYLEARFGGAALTDKTRKEFERRVREIRSFRPAEKPRKPAAEPTPASPDGAQN